MSTVCLHLLWSGEVGGIETLCKEYALHSQNKNLFVFLRSGGEIADEIERLGFRVIRLYKTKKFFWNAIRQLLRICDAAGVGTIVEHHSVPLALLCVMLVKRFRPAIQFVAYAHCNAAIMIRGNDIKRRWIYRKIIQLAFQKADAVVAISNSVKESLQKALATPEHKIKTIYNGVDVKKYQQKARERQTCTKMIYVGRLSPEKGVETILKALVNISNEVPYRFEIVGDGSERERLEAFVREHSLSDRVYFWGTRSDIPEILNQADIFVHMPNCDEGFGITIVEAMASGLLCICAKKGAIPELIRDGENGILVDSADPGQLAEVLMCVLQNQYPMIDSIRKQAVATAQTFSVDKFAENLDTVINKLRSSKKL